MQNILDSVKEVVGEASCCPGCVVTLRNLAPLLLELDRRLAALEPAPAATPETASGAP